MSPLLDSFDIMLIRFSLCMVPMDCHLVDAIVRLPIYIVPWASVLYLSPLFLYYHLVGAFAWRRVLSDSVLWMPSIIWHLKYHCAGFRTMVSQRQYSSHELPIWFCRLSALFGSMISGAGFVFCSSCCTCCGLLLHLPASMPLRIGWGRKKTNQSLGLLGV